MATKILILLLGLILVFAVACGTAAPDPTAAPLATDVGPASEPTAVAPGESLPPTPVPAAQPASTTEPVVNPGQLSIMVGDMATERFDAAFVSGPPGWQNYSRLIHAALISSTETRELTPGIASQWGFSADGLTWTFTLREGVKFNDGTELTTEDVLWTLRHTFGPQAQQYAPSSAAQVSRVIDRIESNAPNEVTLTTKEPVIDMADHVSESTVTWFPVMPERANIGDARESLAYDDNPIGAGFMRLVDHVQASSMSFERFEDYYYQPKNGLPEDRRVNFQSLVMHLVPEESTRVAAVRAGDADIAPASVTTREQVEAGGGRLIFGREGIVIQPNLQGCWEDYPCRDKRVRHALNYAINKEVIRDQLYGGPEAFQIKGWMVVTPSTIGYSPQLDPWPYDPDTARQLLAEAGYPNGQGFGKLIINTRAATSIPFLTETAQLAAESWRRELGLDVEVRVGDSIGLRERLYAGELNGQVYWQENDTRRDATTYTFGSFGDPENPRYVHRDPEILKFVQETLQVLDPEERSEAYQELFVRLRDEGYYLGIGYANTPWAVGPRVLTWEPWPLALYPSALHTVTLK